MKSFRLKFAALVWWKKTLAVIGIIFVGLFVLGLSISAANGTLGKPVGGTTASATPTPASAAPTSTTAKPTTAPTTAAPKATTAPAPAPTSAAPVAPTSATTSAAPAKPVLCESQKTKPDYICVQVLNATQLTAAVKELEGISPGISDNGDRSRFLRNGIYNTCGAFYNDTPEQARKAIAARFSGGSVTVPEDHAQAIFDVVTTKYCPLSKRTEPAPGL